MKTEFTNPSELAAEIDRRAKAFLEQNDRVEALAIELSQAKRELQKQDERLCDLVCGYPLGDPQFLAVDGRLIQIPDEPQENCQVLELTTPEQVAKDIRDADPD